MNRGSWQATVHGLAKHWTRLSDQHTHRKDRLPDFRKENTKARSDDQEFSFSKPILSWLLPEFCRNQTSNSGKQVWTLLESGENCGKLRRSSSTEMPVTIRHQPSVWSPQQEGPVWTHILIFKRSGTINFNMNFSNFYNVGNNLKHIWAKQK